jgi:hypothetical protein
MQGPGACEIVVEAGYILGPYGDEIVIDRAVTVDLCSEGLDGNAVSPCGDLLDPWCSNIRVNRRAGQPLYVAVCYAECQARPVRVQANGCGCNEAECEYSRIRDSFAIKVLTALPSTYSDPMPQPDSEMIISCGRDESRVITGRACPPCPAEPWVILADVTLTAEGAIAEIDCFAHRRYVASFADFYFLCQPRENDFIRPRGAGVLVDRVAERQGQQAANVLVAATRPDNTRVYIPVHFKAQPGETFAGFLAREGGRQLYDPERDETFTLGELYALKGINPQATLNSTDDAIAPLEGLTLRVNDLRAIRSQLASHLDELAVNRLATEQGGDLTAATNLPVTAIKGVGTRSTLGRKVAGKTIGEVANMERTAFIEQALADVPENRRPAVESQARAVWENANRISSLAKTWRKQ